MNRSGLKAASRRCLVDSPNDPRRLTLYFLLALCAISMPCDVLVSYLNQRGSEATGLGAMVQQDRYQLWSMVLNLGINLLSLLWGAGFTAFALRLSRGERAVFDDFFTGLRQIGRVTVLYILIYIYTILWSMLFLLPGLVAAYSYRMALYVLLDNPELTPSEAIAISKRLTYGHKMELFVLDMSFLWYVLLNALASLAPILFARGLLPLSGWSGYLLTYAIGLAITLVVGTALMAYVQTTYAHVYNWLLSLDKARREGA